MASLPRICSAYATSNLPQAACCFGCGQALWEVVTISTEVGEFDGVPWLKYDNA